MKDRPDTIPAAPGVHQSTAARDLSLGLRVRAEGDLLYLATWLSVGNLRLHADGLQVVLDAKAQGRSVVFVGWHGHDFVNLGVYHRLFGQEAHGCIMVRDNQAGLTLVQFSRRMAITPVLLGSDPTQPQWARGVIAMIRLVRSGHDALLAADGPEGPAYVAKPGVAVIAQRAGALLVPVAAAASPAIHLRNRWDAHTIPLPFARGVIHFGTPIETVGTDGDLPTADALRDRLQASLLRGVERAELLCREWTNGEQQ